MDAGRKGAPTVAGQQCGLNPEALDDEGTPVRAGDVVLFSYGIPPVRVEAKVSDIDGVLFAMTPGHKPDKCKLSELRRHVGGFYRIRSIAV